MGIGIVEKSHKTRRDRWGGNVNLLCHFEVSQNRSVWFTLPPTESQNRNLWFTLPPQRSLLVLWLFSAIPIPILKFPIFYSSSLCTFY